MTAAPVPSTLEGLHGRVTDDGHYTWFAFSTLGRLQHTRRDNGDYSWFGLDVSNWGRQASPYEETDGDSRWTAVPMRGGGIRTLVEGVDYAPSVYQTSGFDLHLGPLGDISEIRIRSEKLRSGTLPVQLVVALYLDEDENGEFFTWEEPTGGSERWEGYGGDEMGFVTSTLDVGGTVRIDDETTLGMANREGARSTLGKLKNGEMEWPEPPSEDTRRRRKSGKNRRIDADTDVAVYVGLVDNADGQPVEVLITDVVVVRA